MTYISKFKSYINTIFNSNSEKAIFKNMLKLLTGEGIGRVIGMIATPIITRIYLPSDMGVLSVFASLVAILAPFGTFRYSIAIPLPKNDIIASNLAVLSFFILIISSSLIFLVLFIFGEPILSTFSMESIITYWWLIPLVVFGLGVFEIISQWAVRKRSFTALTKTHISQKIIGVITKIGLGLINIKPLGLLIGDAMSQIGGIGSLGSHFRNDIGTYKKSISLKKIVYNAKKYIIFPKFRVPAQFLLLLSGNIPILFFAWNFDGATTGQIGLATTFLSIPITLISRSIGKAYYSEIASFDRRDSTEIITLTKRIMSKLLKLSIIPFLIILVFGPWCFKVFFGPEWYQAGIFARIMSIYLIARFVYSPISEGLFNVFEKQSYLLILEITRFMIILSIFFCAYIFNWTPLFTIGIYSIGLALQYILSILIVFKIMHQNEQ